MNAVGQSAVIFVWLVLAVTSVSAESWGRSYGGVDSDSAAAVALLGDGDYLVAGTTSDPDDLESGDVWLVRLDQTGEVVWQRRYGGLETDRACCVIETSSSQLLVGGFTESFGAAGRDLWLLALDATGNVLWQKRYHDTDDQRLVAIDETTNGYLLTANRQIAAGSVDAWLLKIDHAGGILWQKTYGTAQGGNVAQDAIAMADGGFTIVGSTPSQTPSTKLWVLRVDALGEIAWQKTYGAADLSESGFAVEALGAEVIVAGWTESYPYYRAPFNLWLLHLDAGGQVLNQKVFATATRDQVSSLSVTSDGGYVLAGWTDAATYPPSGDAWVLKIATDWTIDWHRRYGGEDSSRHDYVSSLHQTTDAGFLVAGGSESFGLAEEDSYDAWVLKLESDGTVPDCAALSDRHADVHDTAALVFDSTVAASATFATPIDTAAAPADTTMLTNDGCHALNEFDVRLPRTGQTTSYYPGDDGQWRAGAAWPAPRFDHHGNGTTTDRLTGLVWFTHANCAKVLGHDPDGHGTGGMNWVQALDFIAAINAQAFPNIADCAGYSASYDDWRAPSFVELESLVNLGSAVRPDDWLIDEGFVGVEPAGTNASPYFYWSSTTTVADDLSGRHVVEFYDGDFRDERHSRPYLVWPVRGGAQVVPNPVYPANPWRTGQTIVMKSGDDGDLRPGVAWPSPRLSHNGDGTVTDNLTKLVWLRDAGCLGTGNFYEAHDAVAAFAANPGPYNCFDYGDSIMPDWRVPNRKELFSVLDWSSNSPKLPSDHPFANVAETSYYVTSTTFGPQTAWVWRISLLNGRSVVRDKTFDSSGNIWAVRGPVLDADDDGVPDGEDNCINVANADQRDTNADGFGNVCDADLDNDCSVNVVDLGLMRVAFFSTDPDADLNGDGIVNVLDLGIMKTGFFQPPGPSGVTNACGGG